MEFCNSAYNSQRKCRFVNVNTVLFDMYYFPVKIYISTMSVVDPVIDQRSPVLKVQVKYTIQCTFEVEKSWNRMDIPLVVFTVR